MKLGEADREFMLVQEALEQLEGVIHSRPGRMDHLLPDLALKMFGVQVLQYSRAVATLSKAGENSWAFPTARAAFETTTDLLYLATADSDEQYDKLGAQAVVGAEIALSKTHGKMNRASPKRSAEPEKQPKPLKARVQRIADKWESHRERAGTIVWSAYEHLKKSWSRGIKHWTGIGRGEIHEVLKLRLKDPAYGLVLDSWYDILSTRSHPGLHSPQFEWEAGRITFIADGDQGNAIPLATVRVSAVTAAQALTQRMESWGTPCEDR